MADKSDAPSATVTDSRSSSRMVGTEPLGSDNNTQSGERIKVRSLRHFHKDESGKGDMVKPGDEFETTRDRAMQLRANGLIEYPDAEYENKLHGESAARALRERHDREAEARKIPDNSRTTPLRNPKLNMPDESEVKR